MSLIGAHISVSQGVDKAAPRAKKQGCEVMQIFVQPPQMFKTPQTTQKEVDLFKLSLKKCAIKNVYAHAPYLINLASLNPKIRYGSISLIHSNLERASLLGCVFLTTHLGSYGEQTKKQGLKQVSQSLSKAFSRYKGATKLLLELSAGSGKIIGSRFEEIAFLRSSLKRFNLGVCLDTAHIFASGYDLCGLAAINRTMAEFDKKIGLQNIKLIHLNDSASLIGSKKDRHADIGKGHIGAKNLGLLLNHPGLKNIPIILETPGGELVRCKDIVLLKSMRK